MIFLRLSSVVMAAFCDKKYVSRRRHVYILRSIFAQPVSYITNRKLFLEKSFSERYLSLSLSSSPVRHWLLFNDAGSKRKFIKLVRLVEFELHHFFFLPYNLFMSIEVRFLISMIIFCRYQKRYESSM